MNIAYVISGIGMGGAESSLVELSSEALRRGHKVMVVSLTEPCSDFMKRFDSRVIIKTLNLKSPLILLASGLLFRKMHIKFNSDIVHSHMIHANLFCAFCRLLNLYDSPLIATAHSVREGRLSFLYKVLKRGFTHGIHVSDVGLDQYIADGYFDSSKSSYAPNGIQVGRLSDMSTLDGSERRFISVGRLVALKNHTLMIDAVVNARRSNCNVSLHIFGDGPLRASLGRYIQDSGADDFIFLRGLASDVSSELKLSHFFLMSSEWEGMPMALLEACGTGLPCVVTDVGSCASVVSDLPLCYCLKPWDRSGYFRSVMYLARASSEEFGAARKLIHCRVKKRYSVSGVFDKLEAAYSEGFKARDGYCG